MSTSEELHAHPDTAAIVAGELSPDEVEAIQNAKQNVTLLRNPALAWIVTSITGFGTSEDGQVVALQCTNEFGKPTVLEVSLEFVDLMIKGLIEARSKASLQGGRVNVRIPATWRVVVKPEYAGVVIVFDEGNPVTQQVIGLDLKAAREFGKSLIAQAQYASSYHKPTIILPGQ
jgi:hypothetical protein